MRPDPLGSERAILGAMIDSEPARTTAFGLLTSESFQHVAHGRIFAATKDAVDVISLMDELARRGELEAIGGPGYLAAVGSDRCIAENVRHHCEIVLRAAQHRGLRTMARVLVGELDSSETPEDIQARLAAMRDLTLTLEHRGPRVLGDCFAQLTTTGQAAVFPHGFETLARIKCREPDLWVVGARPGTGKTAFLGSLAVNAALAGWQVLFFSLEMSEAQIATRLLATHSGLAIADIEAGGSRVPPAMTAAFKLPIYLEDRPKLVTLEAIAAMARVFAHAHADRPIVVMIDYLQLLRCKARIERRHEYVGHLCRGLKELAKECHVPVVVAAQLNRAVEQRGKDAKPTMADLRESGDIEQSADHVLLLHRTEGSETWVRCEKNRHGHDKWSQIVHFVPERACFEDQDWQ